MPLEIGAVLRRKIKHDDAFIISERSSVTAGSTFNIHVKNPVGSGVTLWVTDTTVSGTGELVADVHDGFSSAPSGGSVADIQSLLLDSDNDDNDGVADANIDVSFTSDSSHAATAIGGGSSGASIGGSANHAVLAIQPGREIVIEINNISSSTNEYAIRIVYYETP